MALLTEDVARFRPDDPVDLVAASFACPWCLRTPSRATMTADPHTPFVVCHCRPCDTAWLVHLDGLQYMRIRLAPPPELRHADAAGSDPR